MKNIIMARRYGSDNSWLYEMPLGVTAKPGTILTVEYIRETGSTAVAYAVSNSYEIDETAEKMIADILHIRSLDNLKRVRSVYSETPVNYADEAPDTGEAAAEATEDNEEEG